MLKKLELMLYVEDVSLIGDFFEKALDAKIIKKTEMVDNSISLKLSLLDQVEINLYTVEFVKKYSPMVSLEMPSLMFIVDDIEAIHEQVKKYAKDISTISTQGEQKVFSFADPEGHYFAVGN
ncbi:VOC family protein [Companilactobacillus baiquanensis]|uniref:VOC family protein n=1 Tax=Companilactobacillus baiquanensis TaxID=2486005 RepID=A0ABW1UW23_9LACO|nr:VOC family protein [Companilactobacillus baiquanensis]